MTNHTARMAALLGELRREMNGAVAESMQRGEGGYGLNYGVSIPAIRAIAGRVGTDHAFARFLYRQDVRELRMAALTIADPASVTPDNVDEWFVGTAAAAQQTQRQLFDQLLRHPPDEPLEIGRAHV